MLERLRIGPRLAVGFGTVIALATVKARAFSSCHTSRQSKAAASASTWSMGRDASLPRSAGMMQKLHLLLQPSEILR